MDHVPNVACKDSPLALTLADLSLAAVEPTRMKSSEVSFLGMCANTPASRNSVQLPSESTNSLLKASCLNNRTVGSWGHRLRPNRGLGSMSRKGRARAYAGTVVSERSLRKSLRKSFRKKHVSAKPSVNFRAQSTKHVSESISGIMSVIRASQDNSPKSTWLF